MDHTKEERLARIIEHDEKQCVKAIIDISTEMQDILLKDDSINIREFYDSTGELATLRNAAVGALVVGGRSAFDAEIIRQSKNRHLDEFLKRLDGYLTRMPRPRQ